MHQVNIDRALQTVRAWRGMDHVYSDIDPKRTAHIVLDMQNAFTEKGIELEVPQSRDTIANINAISAALTRAGGVNVFTQMTIDADLEQNWSIWLRFFCDGRRRDKVRDVLKAGSHGHGLDPAIEVGPADIVIRKNRYSAFFPGASPLKSILDEHGIDTLIITGTVTNCCCEATARDAMQLNYKVIFVSDATSALSDEEHNATLVTMATVFADVMTTDEVAGFIKTPLAVGL